MASAGPEPVVAAEAAGRGAEIEPDVVEPSAEPGAEPVAVEPAEADGVVDEPAARPAVVTSEVGPEWVAAARPPKATVPTDPASAVPTVRRASIRSPRARAEAASRPAEAAG